MSNKQTSILNGCKVKAFIASKTLNHLDFQSFDFERA
jgi:hypothetical protein